VHEETVSQGGWTFTARKAPIIGSPLLEEYSDKLGGVLTLPEILFGNSSLQLKHEASGVTLTFNALGALQQWKADDLPPLKVAVASEWQAARQQEIEQQQAVVLDYDWTYTTSYAGELSIHPSSSSSSSRMRDSSATHAAPTTSAPAALATAAAAAAAVGHPSSEHHSNASATNSDQQQQQQAAPLPEWQPTERQIDRHMLMCKNEPILFYAEVPLYESELDDNGVCQLTVKVGGLGWVGGGRRAAGRDGGSGGWGGGGRKKGVWKEEGEGVWTDGGMLGSASLRSRWVCGCVNTVIVLCGTGGGGRGAI
jgi:type 2A phosphatase activator TIP41